MGLICRMPSTRMSTGQIQKLTPQRHPSSGGRKCSPAPHTPDWQEQKGPKRPETGDVRPISAHRQAQTPTPPGSVSLRLPLTRLPKWENSPHATCPGDFCHVSFAQHHKRDPCWSWEGPDTQQGSSPHTRMSPLQLAAKPVGQQMQGSPGESSSRPIQQSSPPAPLWACKPAHKPTAASAPAPLNPSSAATATVPELSFPPPQLWGSYSPARSG